MKQVGEETQLEVTDLNIISFQFSYIISYVTQNEGGQRDMWDKGLLTGLIIGSNNQKIDGKVIT